jgi:TolB-like protein/tetratricopeptide (TPR) repeat protein
MRPLHQLYTLKLLGSFQLSAPNGRRITVRSRKGMALIAMLAMAKDGEHTRVWLEEKLWGARQKAQAKSSLRQELALLKKLLSNETAPLLICDHFRVKLDLRRCDVDARRLQNPEGENPDLRVLRGEFLEGFDIPAEDGFEDWLREQRQLLEAVSKSQEIGSETRGISEQTTALRRLPPLEDSTDLDKRGVELSPRFIDLSRPAPGFSGCPALAILRFGNLTGDPAVEYLAEGISEELVDRLSRLRWLPVISSSSSFAVGDIDAEPKQVGRRLGAGYVLIGRLRRWADALSIVVSLVDTETAVTLWSRRLRMPVAHERHTFDLLVEELVAHLDSQIDHAEQKRASQKNEMSREVHDLIWRGRWHLNRLTPADLDRAGELFAQALEIEPPSSEALIQATFCMGWKIWTARGTEAQIQEMSKMARRAVQADREDGRGYMLQGIADIWLRNPNRAQNLLRTAIELNPSLSLAHAQLGSSQMLAGEPADAVRSLRTALRLSPHDAHVFYPLGELALCHAMMSEWSDAIEHADQALLLRPAYWHAHVTKIASLVRSGDALRALAATQALFHAVPDFSLRQIAWLPFEDAKWNAFLFESLASVAEPRLGRPMGQAS